MTVGNILTVQVTSSESLLDANATINGAPMTLVSGSSTPTLKVFTRTVVIGDLDGGALVVGLKDTAGNTALFSRTSSVAVGMEISQFVFYFFKHQFCQTQLPL